MYESPLQPHNLNLNLNLNTDTYPYHTRPDHHDDDSHSHSSHGGSSSPVAPAYSPITPKVQPVLPAALISPDENRHDFDVAVRQQKEHYSHHHHHQQQPVQLPPLASSSIRPTEYIPEPPPLPFSSDDAGDAIALRAAISTLQFQKKKAQSDIKTLASIKQLALDDPDTFKDELAAGRLSEQRPSLGTLRAILDDVEHGDSDDEVVLGASRQDEETQLPAEIPDSQPSQLASSHVAAESEYGAQKQFSRIPGPQTIVRMPHVNWGKYGIAGEPLEGLHEQQRRWPGPHIQGDRGRDYTIAAPYSPFMDAFDDQQQQQQQLQDTNGARKDSGPAPSLTGTISEHVMETRSRN